MATTLDSVCDLFLSLNQDFRLTALYQSSGSTALNNYLEPWVLMAIDEFEDICIDDLTYSTTTQTFTATLTQKTKNILAQIMTKYWLHKELMDIRQMENFIQDKDFRTHSAEKLFTSKQAAYNAKREEISQLLSSYGYANNDWTSWELQDFA